MVSNNLFVNELANRPSGISVENGRDVLISNNKIVNGMIRKHDELTRIKLSAKDVDELTEEGSHSIDRVATSNAQASDSHWHAFGSSTQTSNHPAQI